MSSSHSFFSLTCSKCNAPIRPHRACTKCGNYNNETVLKVENED